VTLALPAEAWRSVAWREGAAGPLSSRFAAVRTRPAHGDFRLSGPRAEEWLLAEWPGGGEGPTKYWLSTLPATTTPEGLVATARLRWRVERDLGELKREIGLGHVEGRGRRGFRHHAASCVAACGFLAAGRCRPSLRAGGPGPRPPGPGRRPRPEAPGRPRGHRPRGAPGPARAARPGLDRDLGRHLAVALTRRLPRRPCRLLACEPPPTPAIL